MGVFAHLKLKPAHFLVAALALPLVACDDKADDQAAVPAADPDKQAILFTWEGLNDDPFIDAYTEKHGAAPEVAIFADEDEAYSKMLAGFVPDVMGPCTYEVPRWKEAGLLQPIDVSKIENWDKIPAAMKGMEGARPDENGDIYFVPHYWGNTSVTYNPELAPEYVGNESWDILFDPKYKGRVAVMDGVDDTVAFVAQYIGVDIYNMSDADWLKVQAKLKEVVANSRMVTSDPTTIQQAFASGELVAAMTWNDTYTLMKGEGLNVKYMREPKDQKIFTWVCGFSLNSKSNNVEKAYDIINDSLDMGASKYLITDWGYGTANSAAYNEFTAEEMAEMEMPADIPSFLQGTTFQVRIPNKDKVVQVWEEIRAGL